MAFDMNEARSGEDAGASKTSGVHEAAGQLKLYQLLVENSLGLM